MKSKSAPNLFSIGLKTSVRYSMCGPIGTFVPPLRISVTTLRHGKKRAHGRATWASKQIHPAVCVSATNSVLFLFSGPGRNSKRVDPMYPPLTCALHISLTSSTPEALCSQQLQDLCDLQWANVVFYFCNNILYLLDAALRDQAWAFLHVYSLSQWESRKVRLSRGQFSTLVHPVKKICNRLKERINFI